MHALLARIHPSFRRALVSWFVVRSCLWAALLYHGSPVNEAKLHLPWLTPSIEPGAPLWVGLQQLCHALAASGFAPTGSGTWLLVAACESSLLLGAVSVYRFVRSEHLPHTAERATWLWLVMPAAAITLPTSAWSLTAGLSVAALACVTRGRAVVGGLLLAVATGFRPEALLIWPGAVWLGYKKLNSDSGLMSAGPWTLAFAPPAAFTGSIATALLAAGDWGISLRSLQPHARWRSELPWWQLTGDTGLFGAGFFHSALPAIVTLVGVLTAVVLTLSQTKNLPLSWIAIALPVLAWPLAHQPPTAAVGVVLLAAPAAAALGRVTDNRVVERALLAACLGTLLVAVL